MIILLRSKFEEENQTEEFGINVTHKRCLVYF